MSECAIIVRTKNRNLLLNRALNSIAKQTYSSWQVILVNDGGIVPEVDELVSAFLAKNNLSDDRVIVIHNNNSIGMEASSNIAIHNSKSKYVSLLDDDDTWEDSFLTTMIEFLESSNLYKAVACQAKMIEEKIEDQRIKIINSFVFNPNLLNINICDLLICNRFTSHSFVYLREALKDVGVYDETLPVLGDWEFNLRFICRYDIKIIPIPMVNYHKRINLINSSLDNTLHNVHHEYKSIIINKYIRNGLFSNDRIGLAILDAQNIHAGNSYWQNELNLIYNSLSWKITKPIRIITNILRKIKNRP